MRKKVLILGGLLLAVLMLVVAALDQRVAVRTYTVKSDKVVRPVRLAVLADYHGCDDGVYGATMVKQVEALRPDAILLVGDMFSADGDPEAELRMFRQLDSIAFTYYVTGNHEYWEHDVPQLLARIADTGVTVLDQSCVSMVVDGLRINICGIPDPYAYVDTEVALNRAVEDIDHPAFTVLLAHRPELIEKYAATASFDLVVAGHAHGGQVRIGKQGIYSPGQWLLPKLTSGFYYYDRLLVSRGLTNATWAPRINTPCELIILHLEGAN